jgi:CheY-like chemotaxis protein
MPKILLVEDDNNLREIFEMRLKAEGFETVTAGNGEEALVVAMKEKPDLIITDVMMPKLSGFEMLETLRAAPEMANTKAIMMTALGQAEDRARGESLGVIKYLVKSQVTLEDFVRVVREVVQPNAATGAPSVGGLADSNQIQTNQVNKESEMSMPPADPSSTPASDASNPITGGTPADGQQTTDQEQATVQNQINSFVGDTGAGATAGDDTAATAAPADPTTAAAPASDPGAGSSFGSEPATPAAPVDGTSMAGPAAPTTSEPAQPAPEPSAGDATTGGAL